MRADAVPILDLFEKKMRLEVPLFQRQYVWSREPQWEPLWEDISRKFTEFLEGRKDAPVHFLGAMVLDQKQTPSTHVEKRQVIDGQQRLTTLQIVLAVLRDFCWEHDLKQLGAEFEKYTQNIGKMADPETDKFKVWPTQLDRVQFADVISLGSRRAIEEKHPLVRRKHKRSPEPRPRMIEAYLYFSDEVREFFLGTEDQPPLAVERPLEDRVDEAFKALKNALQVVSIDLEQGDDAQVIFETLNARGEPLLPADLLRNYIFLRAARVGESQEQLYDRYWKGFDDEFWRTEVTQGRLKRPRSDLFMQHFLASRKAVDIPIKHLFVEYRHWIERDRPFPTVEAELETLWRQGQHFRRILEPAAGDVVFGLATFMERFDIRTGYPLLLYLLGLNLSLQEWEQVSTTLESYLLRRAVVGWPTKAYNRIFLNLVKSLRKPEADKAAPALKAALSELSGDSSAWPTDEQFAEAWHTRPAYGMLNSARLNHIFRRLNDTFVTTMNERIVIECELTVEHLLPQSWIENWPLPSGERGLEWRERCDMPQDDPRVVATKSREAALETFGNLTVLKQELNSLLSNSPWAQKKPALLESSLLSINQQLHGYVVWDETAIARRGEVLFAKARNIWPGPDVRRMQ